MHALKITLPVYYNLDSLTSNLEIDVVAHNWRGADLANQGSSTRVSDQLEGRISQGLFDIFKSLGQEYSGFPYFHMRYDDI